MVVDIRLDGKGKAVGVPIQLIRFSLKSRSSAYLLIGWWRSWSGGLKKVKKV